MAIHFSYSCAHESDLVVIPPMHTRNGGIYRCHKAALPSLIQLCTASRKDRIDIVVISGFRTLEFQSLLFEDAQRRHGRDGASQWVAPPGRSEHHTGYALDLADAAHPDTDDEPGFENTAAAHWLIRHASEFGFELSFPKNNPQGVGYEPWHWRFCATPEADALFNSGDPNL